jgi:hypothetical protein
VNNIIYEGIASRKSYILLIVAILLFSTISVKFGVISTYGQQPTVNDTAEQVDPILESEDKGMLLATPEPSAKALGTAGDDQLDTNENDNNEKATDTQEKQNSADEATRSSVTDDNDDSNKVSGTSQSDEPRGDDDQNRGDDDQDSENGNEDENDEENEDNDTPLEYRLPFP